MISINGIEQCLMNTDQFKNIENQIDTTLLYNGLKHFPDEQRAYFCYYDVQNVTTNATHDVFIFFGFECVVEL